MSNSEQALDILARMSPARMATEIVRLQNELASTPMQQIVKDAYGRPRFKANSIVEFLAEGRLNEIAGRGFPQEDREQLAQLIGYSIDGFSELFYVSDETYDRAVIRAIEAGVMT